MQVGRRRVRVEGKAVMMLLDASRRLPRLRQHWHLFLGHCASGSNSNRWADWLMTDSSTGRSAWQVWAGPGPGSAPP